MITNFFYMNGYGIYVFLAYVFTIINFIGLYLIVRSQLIKKQNKFVKKFGRLESEKISDANKQKVYREILSTDRFSNI